MVWDLENVLRLSKHANSKFMFIPFEILMTLYTTLKFEHICVLFVLSNRFDIYDRISAVMRFITCSIQK